MYIGLDAVYALLWYSEAYICYSSLALVLPPKRKGESETLREKSQFDFHLTKY